LSLIINSPIFLSYYVKSDEQIIGEAKLKSDTLRLCGRTKFFKSRLGAIFVFLHMLFRDWLTLLFEILTSYYSVVNYRKFIKKSNQIRPHQQARVNAIAESSILVQKWQNVKNRLWKNKSKRGRQLMLMTIILSLISTVSHLIVSISTVFSLLPSYSMLISSVNISYYALVIKNNLNFFIFFCFNTNFRNSIEYLVRMKCFKNQETGDGS
jgi:hypothetical protein